MTALIATHLWQSTLFVGVAALLTLLLRANHARTRYFVWLAASVKFLVPFGALVALGRQLAWRTDYEMSPVLAAVETMTAPFNTPDFGPVATAATSMAPAAAGFDFTPLLMSAWIGGTLLLLATWLVRWQRVRTALRAATEVTQGRELDILRRLERASGSRPLTLLASDGSLEPGIVGCRTPVILWPADISHRMSDAQIEAILLHELAHVKRRDNLLALLHMAVQAVFWFHPLVWFIGARLVDERERACDEEVVRLGADPHQYAESILRTCEYAVESPLPCVAGVTGSDLKRRVVAIVNNRPALRLGASKVALLTVIGLVVAVGPLAAGALSQTTKEGFEVVTRALQAGFVDVLEPIDITVRARRLGPSEVPRVPLTSALSTVNRSAAVTLAAQAPSQVSSAPVTASAPALRFDVASIKLIRNTGGGAVSVAIPAPGRTITRFTHAGSIRNLLMRAYGVPFGRQLGAPEWIGSDDSNYSIAATIPEGIEGTPENVNAMIRSLLADRFKAVVREETRDLPMYDLVLARADKTLGPNITPVASECLVPGSKCETRFGSGPNALRRPAGELGIEGRNQSVQVLSSGPFSLEGRVGRPVIDRTGLTGRYNFDLTFADERVSLTPTALPSLFDALQEQLGLKLVSTRGPVKVLVIVSIERPTED